MEIIIILIYIILGIYLFYEGFKNIIKDVLYWIPGTLCILLGFILFVNGLLLIYNDYKKPNFKPLYQIDPKQEYYIILNNNKYDTVQFGKLEQYIQNDNL